MQTPTTTKMGEPPAASAIENRLLVVAGILDQAIAAVNQAIEDLRLGEEQPPQEGRQTDDL